MSTNHAKFCRESTRTHPTTLPKCFSIPASLAKGKHFELSQAGPAASLSPRGKANKTIKLDLRQLNEQGKPREKKAGARVDMEQTALLTSCRSWLAGPSVRLLPRRSPTIVTQTPSVLLPFRGQSVPLLQTTASTASREETKGEE